MGGQAAEQRAAAEAAAARAPARHLAEAILGRGWRVGLPQLSVGALLCKYHITRKPE